MTFGIGFACPHYAGIVTDRLLSGASSIDDSDKCGSVTYVDGRYAYTFAGLAEVARYRFQTRQQLAQALGEAGRPAQAGGPSARTREALERVARFMTDAMAPMRVHPRDKRVSILLAGFHQEGDAAPVGQLHMVSNFECLSGTMSDVALPEFSVDSTDVRGSGLGWIGSAELAPEDRSPVLDLLQNSRLVPPWEVTKELVRLIRSASDKNPTSIGRRCSSIIGLRDPGPFYVDYHSGQVVDKVDGTAYVVATYGNVGAFYLIDLRLTDAGLKGNTVATRVPAVHKRQACPCGSGRQYRNCHGNPKVVHHVDSYSLSGRTMVFAVLEDGSHIDIFSNAVVKSHYQ